MKVIIIANQKSLEIFPNSDKTFLENTLKMFSRFSDKKDICIQIPEIMREKIRGFAPAMQVFSEPVARGTAAAVGLAAIKILNDNPEEIITVAYSDLPVNYPDKLQEVLDISGKFAKRLNRLILIAVNPTFPATQYGYVQIGKVLEEVNGYIAFKMEDFHEKPGLITARKFLESWRYLWNTGYMIVSVRNLLQIYKKTLPELYSGLLLIKQALGTKLEKEITRAVFKSLGKVSLDKGLYEKVPRDEIIIVPVDLNIQDFSFTGN